MRISRTVGGLIVVAGVAFATGRLSPLAMGPAAYAGEEYEMTPELEALIAAGRPGAFHRSLDALVGDWNASYSIYMEPGAEPMRSTGTVTRKWIMGGRFIHETVEATSEAGTFSGLGLIGFDNADGLYEVAWVDNMSTGIVLEHGTYNPDTQIFTFRGSHRDPASGRLVPTRGVLDVSDADRHVYHGYVTDADGREYLHFEGTSVRKD